MGQQGIDEQTSLMHKDQQQTQQDRFSHSIGCQNKFQN